MVGAVVIAVVVAAVVLLSGGSVWDAAIGGILAGVVIHTLAWTIDHERMRRRNLAEARSRIAAREADLGTRGDRGN